VAVLAGAPADPTSGLRAPGHLPFLTNLTHRN
jgi:hypothetical protein